MAKRKYDYFHVATPYEAENFGSYTDALKFYGKSEKPTTLYGVVNEGASAVVMIIQRLKQNKQRI